MGVGAEGCAQRVFFMLTLGAYLRYVHRPSVRRLSHSSIVLCSRSDVERGKLTLPFVLFALGLLAA